jgi:hypothetical protein
MGNAEWLMANALKSNFRLKIPSNGATALTYPSTCSIPHIPIVKRIEERGTNRSHQASKQPNRVFTV